MDVATATTVLSIIVLASHAQAAAAQSLDNSIPQCAFLNTPEQPQRVGSGDSAGGLQTLEEKASVEEQVVTCDKATNFCFALWLEDESGNQTIIKQGCWSMSGKQGCERSECVAKRGPSRAAIHPNTKFCCCSGSMCNTNVTDYTSADTPDDFAIATAADEQPFAELTAPDVRKEQERQDMLLLIVVSASCAFVVLAVAAIVGCYMRHERRKIASMQRLPGDAHLLERASELPAFKVYSPEHLKLIETVGQGRYGSVWRGTLRELEVAVKIFPGHYRNYFLNERDIYSLPFMEHPSLLTYFGCDERTGHEGGPELLLVLSYAPLGCLQDFLRHTTPDWQTFCRMSASISSGLAHLHTDIKKGESAKPCVSHRDLNSRNILVKADLSCCICDLGLAMKISGSKYYCNGEEQRAETKSINDVGTLRYMAPEVLEGAVNLRDCESSLKQIDVYALGLVLWELAVRCPDLYVTGLEAPSYRLPFEAEIGLHPTFEQMQVLVSRHKARPLLPETWRDTACVRLLRETIEDCWDQDAEARLTALCVDERLRELPTTWERHRGTMYASGVSPTVNLTSSQVSTAPANNNNNNNHNNNNTHNGLLHCTLDNRLHLPEIGPDEPGTHRSRHLDKDAMDSTVSEGTVETLVTLSPSEPGPDPMCKNAQLANSQQTMPSALQPYQGRNPCLERNLMSLEPEPQLLANGNTLVDLSAMTTSATDEVAAESHSLLAHDSLQHNATTSTALRPATPIPFVQNAVFETDPLSSNTIANGGCPKQPNVPGNGRRPTSHVPSRWSWLLGNGMRLRLFSDTSSGRRKPPQTHHNRSSTGSALLLRDVGNGAGTRDARAWEDETKSSNLSRSPPPLPSSPPAVPQLVKTKVSLKQGSPVCTKELSPPLRPRPSSLALGSPDWLKVQRQMRPPSAHIKTPKQHAPSGRFSLYDDRIMSEQLVVTTEGGRETRATSVPGDIMNC